MTRLPAISLAAVPGRRKKTIQLAKDIEARGFSGIFGPSLGDSLALCQAIALETSEITIGTSITPIYTRNPTDFAQTAAFIHEVSDGRFKFGVGVSHEPALKRMGISAGKPLQDMRQFVTDLQAVPRVGELPPIVLATLRDKMIRLAEEIGGGMVFANGARSHMEHSLSQLEAKTKSDDDFFIGNIFVPLCHLFCPPTGCKTNYKRVKKSKFCLIFKATFAGIRLSFLFINLSHFASLLRRAV